jgi:NAD(P)-dependent dehydrogenase (short-subunit alcohol dehydrogenase family)
MEFDDRVVLVTGAAGNLGRVVATTFGARGATVVAIDQRAEGLAAALGGESDRLAFAPADLLDQAATTACVERAIGRFGRVDVLCNVAGGFRMGEPVHETTDATWRFLFDVNARTMLHAVRAVVPHMLAQGRGKIVNVGAHSAQRGLAEMGAYCAAKATVIRLTESMAAELRERGVNVNCVLPATIDTPDNRAAMPGADSTRWVPPEDLANVILFLASDAARAVHGAAVPVTALG